MPLRSAKTGRPCSAACYWRRHRQGVAASLKCPAGATFDFPVQPSADPPPLGSHVAWWTSQLLKAERRKPVVALVVGVELCDGVGPQWNILRQERRRTRRELRPRRISRTVRIAVLGEFGPRCHKLVGEVRLLRIELARQAGAMIQVHAKIAAVVAGKQELDVDRVGCCADFADSDPGDVCLMATSFCVLYRASPLTRARR